MQDTHRIIANKQSQDLSISNIAVKESPNNDTNQQATNRMTPNSFGYINEKTSESSLFELATPLSHE